MSKSTFLPTAGFFQLTSERLRYRALTQADVERWLVFTSDPASTRYLGVDPTKTPRTLAEEWIAKQLERYSTEGTGLLAVEEVETGAFVGMGGLIKRELIGITVYEVAYSLLPHFRGWGYATEIAATIKEFALRHVPRQELVSIIHQDNEPSKRVAERNGMRVLFSTVFMHMPVQVYGLGVQQG